MLATAAAKQSTHPASHTGGRAWTFANCLVFVGAGSSGANCGVWPDFRERLCFEAMERD
jgi:hypothetical protein